MNFSLVFSFFNNVACPTCCSRRCCQHLYRRCVWYCRCLFCCFERNLWWRWVLQHRCCRDGSCFNRRCRCCCCTSVNKYRRVLLMGTDSIWLLKWPYMICVWRRYNTDMLKYLTCGCYCWAGCRCDRWRLLDGWRFRSSCCFVWHWYLHFWNQDKKQFCQC